MIEKITTKTITLTKNNAKELTKFEGVFFVASKLYDGLQEMTIEITDPIKLASFQNADKPTRRTIIEAESVAKYDEWVKQYAVDRIETYEGEDEIKKVIGNPTISK